MTVDAPLDKVISVILPFNGRTEWDPDVQDYIIEELDEHTTVLHATYIPSGFVAKLASPRDFCRVEYLNKHSDDFYSMAYSQANHPGCQKLKGFVRGVIYTSGVYCKRNLEDSSKTDVVFFYQSDVKIFIPHRIMRMTACRHGFEMADEMKKQLKNENDEEMQLQQKRTNIKIVTEYILSLASEKNGPPLSAVCLHSVNTKVGF
ncbi:stAR-related lipid transfer protein 5-like [Amphiura filiformis]|uniref:stAR-related lipid transfer protein 5-like n=1 Tax=Amphiura filiformis TaxID=82378 RepID=UPI003B21FB3B